MHYLDNASTTAVHPGVVAKVAETMAAHYANPSSLYGPGVEAEGLIWACRETVARAMGFTGQLNRRSPQVVFTGSGTESNNLAILGAARARREWGNHLVATGYEHPSVANPLQALARYEGFRLDIVPPGPDGRVDPAAIAEKVGLRTALVCAMQVNNETGAVLDIPALAKAVKEKNPRAAFHVDGVQGFCKLPPLLAAAPVDSYAVSGHKLHAPKGIGALYLRQNLVYRPPLTGGGQEGGRRPGTENTPYIAGFALAVKLALARREQDAETLAILRRRLLAGLAALEGIQRNGPEDGYPGIINFSLPGGLRSETMLHFLERRGVYVSSGSACSGGAPSHTLTAMGLPPTRVDSALRVSPSGENTVEDIDALLDGLSEGIATLARPRAGRR